MVTRNRALMRQKLHLFVGANVLLAATLLGLTGIAMAQTSSLRGTVVDNTGRPISGARVCVAYEYKDWAISWEIGTHSDAGGAFVLGFGSQWEGRSSGAVRLFARKSGFVGEPSEVFAYPSSLPDSVTLHLAPCLRVSGKIKGPKLPDTDRLWVVSSGIIDVNWMCPSNPMRDDLFRRHGTGWEWLGSEVLSDGAFTVEGLRAGRGYVHVCIGCADRHYLQIVTSVPVDTTRGDVVVDIDVAKCIVVRSVELDTDVGVSPSRGVVFSLVNVRDKNVLWLHGRRPMLAHWQRLLLGGESSFAIAGPAESQNISVMTWDYATAECVLDKPTTAIRLRPGRTINLKFQPPERHSIRGGSIQIQLDNTLGDHFRSVRRPIEIKAKQEQVSDVVPDLGRYMVSGKILLSCGTGHIFYVAQELKLTSNDQYSYDFAVPIECFDCKAP